LVAQTNGVANVTAPGTFSGNTVPGPPPGVYDNCSLDAQTTDAEYRVTIPYGATWTFETCGNTTTYDTYMYLGTARCTNNITQNDDACNNSVGFRGSRISRGLCPGSYSLTIEGFCCSQQGNYRLVISGSAATLSAGSISGGGNGCVGWNPGSTGNSSSASGALPPYTYQWQQQTNCSGGFSNISGATGTTYNPPTLSTTMCYRRRVTDACGVVAFSNTITYSISPDPSISITGGTMVCYNTGTTLTASASGGVGTCTYQWQRSTTGTGGWTNVGGNSSTYNTGNLTNDFYYRCQRICSGGGCNTATSNVELVYVDNIPPTISCLGDIVRPTDAGACDAFVTVGVPTFADNCPNPTLSNSFNGTTNATGTYPEGLNFITWTVTDAAGNTATCPQVVYIVDVTPPTISCPSGITQDMDLGACEATVSVPVPTTSDNCSLILNNNSYNGGPDASGTYPEGATTVTWTAIDVSGNTATCSTTITVNPDSEPPSLVCPADIVQDVDVASSTATVNMASPVVIDNCPGANAVVNDFNMTSDGSGTYSIGITTVNWTATDGAGNTSTCSMTVNIEEPSVSIACPADINQNNDAGVCNANVAVPAPVVAGGSTFVNDFNNTSDATDNYPVGTTLVTWTATSSAGATAFCTMQITVNDNENPTISCPSSITQNTDAGGCDAVVTYTAPTTSDNCPGETTSLSAGQGSGGTFQLGTTTESYQVVDAAGNTASCSFMVTVVDAENPSVTCPADMTVNSTAGLCGAIVPYTTPIGTDNCPNPTTALSGGLGSGSIFSLGANTETYTVTDAAGNTGTCSFMITVEDTEAPQIVCPPNVLDDTDAGTCDGTVTVGSPVILDNCTGTTYGNDFNGTSDASGTYPLGVTTIEWSATDGSGNSSTCTMTVTITDDEDPDITCPADMTANTDAGSCDAVVTYTAPTGTDNCTGQSTALSDGLGSGGTFALGANVEEYTVTDAAGNNASCDFTVTVVDGENPSITCPADMTLANTPGLCAAIGFYTPPVGTDNCPGSTTAFTSGLGNGGFFQVGTATEVYTVTDAAGNSASCSFTITVEDTQDPTISCPPSQIVSAGTNCDATVSIGSPIVLDNCPGVTYDNNFNGTSDASDTYSLGVTTIEWSAADGAGNTSSCSMTITVEDDTDPLISCPANMTVGTDAGSCDAVVTYTAPTGTDACPGVSTALTGGSGSGGTFALGTNTETYTATDGAGNTASCSFTILVQDNEAPAITCPTDITVGNDAGDCSAVVTYTTPVGTDNCPGVSTLQLVGFGSGGTFAVGSTTESYRTTDAAGNTSSCSFTITVEDTEAPQLTCPADITQSTSSTSCDASVTVLNANTRDNCAVLNVGNDYTNTNNASGTYPLGVTTIEWSASDGAGNSSTCTMTVTIVDDVLPTISCPSDMTASVDAGSCDAILTYTAPTDADNCPGQTTAQTAGLGSGSAFPVGSTTEEYTVTDAAGNTALCSFTITVEEDEDPTITCPADMTVNTDAGVCTAVVTYTAPTGSDNCPASSTALTAGLGSGGSFALGMNTETYTVTDAAGNEASCSFTITVEDSELPQITCPADITQSSDPGICAAIVIYTEPTGTDNCTGASTSLSAGVGSGSLFPLGTNTEAFTVTDASGNSASCSFSITITDDEAPSIICPANVVENTDADSCNAMVTVNTPIPLDNCPGTTFGNDYNSTTNATDTYPLGLTTIVWSATDGSGNTSTCAMTVTILDNEDPEITCPTDIAVNTDAASCDAVVNYTAPVGTDNCTGESTALTAGLGSGSTFPLGTTTEEYTVTDGSGNTASCSFNIIISDNEMPTVICPSPITQGVDAGICGAIVTYNMPTTGDNCPSETVALTSGLGNGSEFPVGTSSEVYTVTDGSGNTATCSFDVTINDGENPLISCPASLTVGVDGGTCSALVTYTTPVGTDNCPGATTAQTAGTGSGSTFSLGVSTEAYTVTDAAGNSASCNFTITVLDNEQPGISCPTDIVTSVDAGSCNAIVTYTTPVGTDNCPSPSTAQTSGLGSGGSFPVGVSTEVYTVTDGAGNTASCSFMITVEEDEDPTITCPSDITANTDIGACAATVTYSAPTGLDNCPGASTALTSGLGSGGSFGLGASTEVYTVTDAAGNSASCSFMITVFDVEDPVTTCPADITQTALANACEAVVFADEPTVTDNCSGSAAATYLNDYNNTDDASGIYPVGMTTVNWTSTDGSGNTSSCTMTITVTDDEAPSVVCPLPVSVGTDAGSCTATVTVGLPITSDNCGVASAINDFNNTSNASDTYSLGSTTVLWTVTDIWGNTDTCSMVVTVMDDEDPAISCPTDITTSVDAGSCGSIVTYTAPAGTDNCLGVTTAQTAGLGSGSLFPIGTTTEEWTTTDGSGNTAMCSFTVTVEEDLDPTISCPSNIATNVDAGACGATVTFTTPSGNDNCPGATTMQTGGLASGDLFPLGTTTQEFTVTDAAGNSASCSFDVTVTDNEAPMLTCPPDQTVSTPSGACDASVTIPAPMVSDNCPGVTYDNTFTGTTDASGTFPLGVTTINWSATDGVGNSSSCLMTITVEDDSLPTISCPANMSVSTDAGSCTATVTYTTPVGTDGCPSANTVLTNGLGSGSGFPVGTTTEEYTVTDAAGNSASCSFDVIVSDDEIPAITCGSNITQSADAGSCDAALTIAAPTNSDNCGVASLTNDFTGASDATGAYPTGMTTVTWTVTDMNGNTNDCSITVTITDDEDPALTCPADMTQPAIFNTCETVIFMPTASVSDNCTVTSYANDFNNTTNASGIYPVGTTDIVWSATDGSGNLSTCMMTVTVEDQQEPSIVCPLNVGGTTDAGSCDGAITVAAPTVSDNCGVATTVNDYNSGTDASDTYPVGNTVVLWTVTDIWGNSDTCSMIVVVVDNEAPSLTCPSDVSLATSGSCDAIATIAAPTNSDACGIASVTNDYNNTSDASDTYPLGTTTVMWTATDVNGNTTTCSLDVEVTDSELPLITCPADISQATDPDSCTATVMVPAPTTSDNCMVTSLVNDINGTSDASGSYLPGTTTITWTVTDNSGNSSSCSLDVTVTNSQNPTIVCPADIVVSTDAGLCNATITVAQPVSSDNCGLTSVNNSFTGGSDASGTYPLGTTTVTWIATDINSNASNCSMDVTVEDNEMPTLSCPADMTLSADPSTCDAVVTAALTANGDNCGVASITNDFNSTSDASDTYPLGMTDVVYTIDDVNGNSNSCSFSVTVENVTPPTLSCPADTQRTAFPGVCEATVFIPVPTTGGGCGAVSLVNDYTNIADASGTYPVGTTTVTWTSTDATGNVSTCSIDVTVTDDEIPTVACPANISRPAALSHCDANVIVPVVSGADNCGVASLMNDYTNTSDGSGVYNVGTTTVTFTVTDIHGNTGSCSFDVTVTEDQNPDIICPADVATTADAGACTAALTVGMPTAADNCGIATVLNDYNSTSDASDTYNVGSTTVVWTATDVNGNTSTCSITVDVDDVTAPSLACPPNATGVTNPGLCGASVTVASPTVSDDCSVASITNNITGTSDASSTYTFGTTNVFWTATDVNGNASTCLMSVIVQDDQDPLLFCPSDITQAADSGVCEAAVAVPTPVSVDNCGANLPTNDYTNTPNASGTYPVGTTTVVWSVTDIAGNTSSCAMTITVEDLEAPDLACAADVTQATDAGSCDAMVTVPQPVAVVNCGMATLTNDITGTSDANGTYALGSTTITWTAADQNGNTSTCAMDVVVEDMEMPMIACPADVTQSTDAGSCDAVVAIGAPTTSDNCSVASTSNDFNNTSDASDTYMLGATTVEWTVVDGSGNSATCAMTVTIEDTEMPTIACPADMTQAADPGVCTASIMAMAPTTSDNCGVASAINDFNNTSDASGIYVEGATVVTWTVTDNSGNTASCSWTVTVEDSEAPAVACAADITQSADSGACDAMVMVPAPTVTNNCVATVTVTNDYNNTSDGTDTYGLGTTSIVWTVSDPSGNSSTCSMSVTVVDDEPSAVVCPSDVTQAVDAGTCEAAMTLGAPVTTDNCGSSNFTNDYTGTSDASGTYPEGSTTVTWTVIDANSNAATCAMVVTVEDTEAPSIACPTDVTRTAVFNVCDAVVFYPAATATDNCSNTMITNDFDGSSNASGNYPVGSTTVTWTATDAGSNTATCSMTVTVTDDQAPAITCPPNIARASDPGACDAMVTVSAPAESDNCGVASRSNNYNNTSDATDVYPVGITMVQWTVTDVNGVAATCEMEVEVEDVEMPTIVCPADVTTNVDVGICGAMVTVGSPTVSDNCTSLTLMNDMNSTSDASGMYDSGDTDVVWSIEDVGGNIASCMMRVSVMDDEMPTAICPPDIRVDADTGLCTAAINVAIPATSDNCGVTTFTNNFNNTSNASDTYPVGATRVDWTITDSEGNMTTCSTLIEIVDDEEPLITCPSDMTVDTDPGLCKKLALPVPIPATSDNCTVASLVNDRTGGQDASGAYSLGTSVVTWTVTDGVGESATCSISITVEDNEAPVVQCPANSTHNAPVGACQASVNVAIPTPSDACGIVNMENDYTGTSDASAVYPIGTTAVEWTVTDVGGNTGSCSMAITVSGDVTQGISCPADVNQSADPSSCQAFVTIPTFVTTGSCGVVAASNNYTGTSNASGLYPVGTTTVTWSLSDVSGNFATCSMTVTITDDVLDVTCPGDVVRPVDPGVCSATINVPGPSSTDNCGGLTLTNTYNGTSDASDTYPEGVTSIGWSISDANGNTANCVMFVLITDDEAPTITCPSDMTESVGANGCVANIVVPQPNVADNCGVSLITNSYTGIFDASGEYGLGVTNIQWTVFDTEANTATCDMTITVIDNAPPVLVNCPTDISVANDAGQCNAVVMWTPPMIGDTCTTNSLTASHNPGDQFPVGTTPVTYSAQDASGNTSSCGFNVIVTDQDMPLISCGGSVSQSVDAGGCTASVAMSPAAASDACSVPTVTNDFNGTSDASGAYPVGSTMVTWMATDAGGNMASCTVEVIVTDDEFPALTCPGNVSQAATTGGCDASVFVGVPAATDNCGMASLANDFNGTSNASGTYPVGTTTVVWTATDVNANETTCSFDVVVSDNELPQLSSCPSNITVSADAGTCSAIVSWTAPTATDNCGNVTLSASANSGMSFNVGTTAVDYTFSDDAGNDVSCTFDVIVQDNELPVIGACPSDASLALGSGCLVPVTISAPLAVDNCGIQSVMNDFNGTSDASGNFAAGTHLITWTVADAFGNTATCSHTISVADTDAPSVSCPSDLTQTPLAGNCEASVSIAPAGAGDNCNVASVTNDFNGTTDASDVYPTGSTTVTWTAADDAGNTATCSFVVTIESPISVAVSGGGSTQCAGATSVVSATASGGSGSYTFEWLENGSVVATGNVAFLNPSVTTTYTARATDNSGGCAGQSDVVLTVIDNSSTCANADEIAGLPFVATGMTTECAGDDYDANDACGSNYMNGEDYVFEFTPTASQSIDVTLSNTANATGVFVFDGCPDAVGTNCVAQATSAMGNPELGDVTLLGGTTYYIVVATQANPGSTPFDIAVEASECGRDIFEPNNAMTAAAELPGIGVNLNARICVSGDVDWFWHVANKSNIQFTLSGLAVDCGLNAVYSNVVTTSDAVGLGDEVVTLTGVTVGDTVFLRVFGVDGASSSKGYNLHVVERDQTIAISKDAPGKSLVEPLEDPEAMDFGFEDEIGFNLYPNPATDVIFVRADGIGEGATEFVLYNANGQVVLTAEWKVEDVPVRDIDLSRLSEGIYYYQLRNGSYSQSGEIVRMY